MNRVEPRRRSERGSMGIFAITLSLLVLVVGLGMAIQIATVVAGSRAQSLSDATAHSASALLAAHDDRAALSRELQMGFRCLYDRKRNVTSLDDDSGQGDSDAASQLCHEAFANAKYVLWRNDPRARIDLFSVDADSRDYTSGGGATRLWAWTTVAVDGPLAHFPGFCSRDRIAGNEVCRVAAASAAREWG